MRVGLGDRLTRIPYQATGGFPDVGLETKTLQSLVHAEKTTLWESAGLDIATIQSTLTNLTAPFLLRVPEEKVLPPCLFCKADREAVWTSHGVRVIKVVKNSKPRLLIDRQIYFLPFEEKPLPPLEKGSMRTIPAAGEVYKVRHNFLNHDGGRVEVGVQFHSFCRYDD